jgi:PAS domain-containing protein
MQAGPGVLISLLSIGAASYLCLLLSRRRASTAARPLLAFAVLVLVTLVAYTTLYVPGPVRNALVALTGIELAFGSYFYLHAGFTSLAGALWFLFALRYTGRGDRLSGLAVRVLVPTLLLAALLIVGSWIAGWAVRGRPVFEVLLSLTLFLTTGLFVLGILFVAETAWRRNAVGLEEAGLLAFGAVTFAVTSLLALTFTSPAITPTIFLLGTLQLTAAVRAFPVFEALPVARVAGRDRLIEGLDDAVLVVDTKTRLRDHNERAAEVFDRKRDALERSPLQAVFPEALDPSHLAQRTEPVTIRTTDGVVLSVRADPVRDTLGRQFGHVLRCSDITDRHQREQRRRLVHQLLTGRLGDQLTTIAETAQTIQAEGGDTTAAATDITDAVGSLKTLVTGTRRIEQAIAGMETTAVVVSEQVTAVVDERSDSRVHTDETVMAAAGAETVVAAADPDVLRAALSMLLDALGEVAHGEIELSVEDGSSGPGILIACDTWDESGTRGEQFTVTRDIVRLAIQSLGGTMTTTTDSDGRDALWLTLPAADTETDDRLRVRSDA